MSKVASSHHWNTTLISNSPLIVHIIHSQLKQSIQHPHWISSPICSSLFEYQSKFGDYFQMMHSVCMCIWANRIHWLKSIRFIICITFFCSPLHHYRKKNESLQLTSWTRSVNTNKLSACIEVMKCPFFPSLKSKNYTTNENYKWNIKKIVEIE